MIARLPSSKLFPYTTLFRSRLAMAARSQGPASGAMETLARRLDGDRVRPHPAAGGNAAGRARLLVRSVGLREMARQTDRKSTRLNSSHTVISYAVFCLKKQR